MGPLILENSHMGLMQRSSGASEHGFVYKVDLCRFVEVGAEIV